MGERFEEACHALAQTRATRGAYAGAAHEQPLAPALAAEAGRRRGARRVVKVGRRAEAQAGAQIGDALNPALAAFDEAAEAPALARGAEAKDHAREPCEPQDRGSANRFEAVWADGEAGVFHCRQHKAAAMRSD